MTLADVWRKQSKAEGKAEGLAEGAVSNILELYKDGDLSAIKARTRLELIAQREGVPRDLIDKALLEIKGRQRKH